MTVPQQFAPCRSVVGRQIPPERGVTQPYDPGKEEKFHRGWAANRIRPRMKVYSKVSSFTSFHLGG
jgi:hypothetical protein